MSKTKETLGFQAEVTELLNLMINSLYSNKEIAIRELISNASDACDKLRFLAISNDKLYEGDNELKIKIDFDAKERTVTVTDNGIGMTHDEIIQNIGTIAKSGTKEFFKSLTGDSQKDAKLIGQFGVGFYSSFIIADKVTIKTRKAGEAKDTGQIWESDGKGEYSLEQTQLDHKGTQVILHLKKDEDEFLSEYRLQEIIRKYSDHISIPIIMKHVEEDEKTKEKITKDITINKANALWKRARTSIKNKEYNEFYKSISHDFNDPLTHIHAHMEGTLEYSILFYIPTEQPFDLWTNEKNNGVKLYVKRVFISDDTDKLLPRYLRFLRGVIDSDDLSLNVSREILQDNQIIVSIKNTAVKKVLDHLDDLAANKKDDYYKFWKAFGPVIKEGVVEDFVNKDRIAKLARFSSTFDDKETQEVSLDDYIFRAKKDQDKIYYIIADSFAAAKNSPLLEIFRKKNIEVLLLSDRVDHWFVSQLAEFNGKKLQSISKGDVDVTDDAKESKEDKKEEPKENTELTKRIQEALKDTVKEVRISKRLTTSPACIVSSQNDLDPSLKRLFDKVGHSLPSDKPILEINPEHKILKRMINEKNDRHFSDWSLVLYDQAILSDGGHLDDPAGFVKRLNELLVGIV